MLFLQEGGENENDAKKRLGIADAIDGDGMFDNGSVLREPLWKRRCLRMAQSPGEQYHGG